MEPKLVGVGPEISIGKVMAKANLSKVSVEFAIGILEIRQLSVDVVKVNI